MEKFEGDYSVSNTLLTELVNALPNINNVCLLDHSDIKLFNEAHLETGSLEILDYPDLPKNKYDLIVNNSQLGKKVSTVPDYPIPSYNYSANIALISSYSVNEKGFGLFLIEPNLMRHGQRSIRSILSRNNFHIKAFFNLNSKYYDPLLGINPILILVSKEQDENVFIAEIAGSEFIKNIIENYINKKNGVDIWEGIFVKDNEFNGFNNWRILQEINKVESEYKTFHSYELGKIIYSLNFSSEDGTFNDKSNCIYFPRTKFGKITNNYESIKKRSRDFYQLECKEDIVNTDYLVSFFESKLGKLIHESMKSEQLVSIRSKETLYKTTILIPEINQQLEIVKNIKKLNQIIDRVDYFKNQIAVNPISSEYVLQKIDQILDVVGQLAEEDKIKSLIKQGESRSIEFKSSFCLDISKQTKEKYIQDSSIKSIAGFLNTFGGNLLIGVDDKKNILGIEPEINKFFGGNDDDFLLHFKNILKSKLGEEFYEFIDHKIVKVNKLKILVVNCKQALDPVYVEDKDFYVRVNPATDRLEGPKQFAYIKNHFYKNKFKE